LSAVPPIADIGIPHSITAHYANTVFDELGVDYQQYQYT